MSNEETELVSTIENLTRERWEKSSSPLLLSQLGPELIARGFSFKELIKPLTLKQYIELNLSEKVSFVVHPNQRQKIGIIPHNETYEFDLSEQRYRPTKPSIADLYTTFTSLSRSAQPERDLGRRFSSNQTDLLPAIGGSKRFTYNEKDVSDQKIRAFLSLLDGLTSREIDNISIPLRTLVRMFLK